MNLSTHAASSPSRTRAYEVHHLQQTLLDNTALRGLMLLQRDGSVERAVGSGEAALKGLAPFAFTNFDLMERLGAASSLGSPCWIMARLDEGQVIIYTLGGGRLLLALAAHEASLDPLLKLLDACFWRCTPQGDTRTAMQS